MKNKLVPIILQLLLFPLILFGQTLNWEFPVETNILSSPAVAEDGTIFFGSANKLYALNPSGSQKWSFQAGDKIWSSPAIDKNGIIYFGCFDKKLYALNPDGSLKWTFPVTTEGSSPALDHEGNIYIGSHGLVAISPDGQEKWRFGTYSSTVTSPSVASNGTIYYAHGKFISALDPMGDEKWRFEAGEHIRSTPAIDTDGVIYFGADDGYLYAVNHVGYLKWKFRIGAEIYGDPVIGENQTIFVGAQDGNLYAVNRNGTEKWRFSTGKRIYAAPTIAADGVLYFGSYSHYFYAVNADGTEKWRFPTNDAISASASIVQDGTIYFGSHDRKFRSLTDDGQPLAMSPWPKFKRDLSGSSRSITPRSWPILQANQAHPLFTQYGEIQSYGYHYAIDIYGPANQQDLIAPIDCVVKYINTEPGSKINSITLQETETKEALSWSYGHVEHESVAHWNVGEVILKGEVVGSIVAWYSEEGDHTHFSVWRETSQGRKNEHPLLFMGPAEDPDAPFIHEALPSSQFAFCQNETDQYMSPNKLSGEVDIIAKIADNYLYDELFPESIYRNVTPYTVWFQIENMDGEIVYGPFHTITFQGEYFSDGNGTFQMIYKDDDTCPWVGRNIFFVLTNTDGDGYPQLSDADYTWNTDDFPVGKYKIRCWAADFNNVTEAAQNVWIGLGWSWKRVTQLNLDDAHHFLNGIGAYSQKIKNAEITLRKGHDSELVIYYHPEDSPGWRWKRVTNLDLDDANHFLNGTGGYSEKIKNVEAVAFKEGSRTDLILFYQPGGNESWRWKRVTKMNLDDALNFLNATGTYSPKN